MAKPIEFWFDYSSPYGFLASEKIGEIAARHGRAVDWRPFLMGAVFKVTGTQPLVDVPMKGDYTRHDMARAARALGIRFTVPAGFPFMSVGACRASYWAKDRDPVKAQALMQGLYRKAWSEGGDISHPGAVVAQAEAAGFDGQEVEAAMNDAAVKDRLRAEVDAGMAKGVFGSPFFFVDGEPFWGHDRLAMVDRWLATGGW